jgi:hypothetical protein
MEKASRRSEDKVPNKRKKGECFKVMIFGDQFNKLGFKIKN